MFSDEEIYKNVVEKLKFEPGINASNIIVGAKDGIVTLTGTIDTYAEKWAAERAAKSVKGVQAVVNELKVKLLEPFKRTDAEIAQAAVSALKWNQFVPDDKIKIVVDNGYVTLSGEVDWNFEREEAEKTIRRLEGIKGITNLITIRKRVVPEDVKKQIIAEFERNAEIDARNITVEVNGSEVTLRGKVHSWEEVKQALHAAWSVPGVASVKNELVIEPIN